jgi:dihydroneopterin aldolase
MDSKKDFIFIEGLEARCVIGIFDWERKVRQRVRIDLEFLTDARRAARKDRVGDTVNYKAIAKRILEEVQKSHYQLVESLAEFIAGFCLKEFNLRQVTVRISKPNAIRGAENVGVQITRRRG